MPTDAPPPQPSTARRPVPARAAALRVLADLREGRRTAHEHADTLLGRLELEPRERALAMELLLGAIRHRLTLTRVLRVLAVPNWHRLGRQIQHILMLGVYQLLWLDGIPAFAAVNEAVRQAKAEGGEKAGRFVNAVLRTIQRKVRLLRADGPGDDPRLALPLGDGRWCILDQPVLPDPRTEWLAWLSTATSHPEPLVARWRQLLGDEAARRICETGQRRPPIQLRPNRLRIDAAGLIRKLAEEGIEAVSDSAWVALRQWQNLHQSTCYQQGLFQVQDRTAGRAAVALDPKPGQRIIDLCAAPGTKTTQLAELMNDTGLILASDKDAGRLALLADNQHRLGLNCIRTVPPAELAEVARQAGPIDAILIDAPCSNTGVLARRPEARYRISLPGLKALAELQLALLGQAAELAGPTTRLCYATCSIEIEENEAVIAAFCQQHPDWRLDRCQRSDPDPGDGCLGWQDGGYWALLIRG